MCFGARTQNPGQDGQLEDVPPRAVPVRPPAAKSRPPTRPPSRQASRHGELPRTLPSQRSQPHGGHSRPPSQHGRASRPSSSRQPSSRLPPSRPSSSHQSSSRPSSSHRRRDGRDKRSSRVGPIPEDEPEPPLQPPDDSAIQNDANVLNGYIFHHASNFYSDSGPMDGLHSQQSAIRQSIGKAIIDRIVLVSRPDWKAVAVDLSNDLEPYISNSGIDPRRRDHLYELCSHALHLGRLISWHPGTWNFGHWESARGNAVLFPSLLKNGEEVLPEVEDI
ncbi:hypothetical protein FGG08_000479 [Glutinoglossum americanum]|uniref:Uncharacterized protein n=1 Tax=Glutinoglossum americanum TaxID=1670608 RepID=A0A9P8IDC7_9PEZI|nr:hypothetical protein FGG08_000479 [Glutinoglossum americanum]